MYIPEHLSGFKKSTLLVVADGEHALFYSIHDRDLESVGELAIEYPPKEDMERMSAISPSGTHWTENNENLKHEKERRFSHMIADELFRRLERNEYEELIFVCAHEELQTFLNALHNDVRARLIATLPKALTKEPILDVLERIQKEIHTY